MASSNFLQAALDLLGRPGNAVRGAVIDGPQGALQGLTGARHFDGTELPGVRDLPDEGLTLGPIHATPRTVAGFVGSTLLDPLTYVGGGLGRLGGLGRGAEAADDLILSGAKFRPGLADLPATTVTAKGYLGDAVSDPIEKLIDHANSITPGHEIVADSPEAAESAVADQTGSEAGRAATRVTRIDEMTPNPPPSAEATPIGDRQYAKSRDEAAQVAAQLRQKKASAANANDWLTYTAQDRGQTFNPAVASRPGEKWEDVIGVPRGTDPASLTPEAQEAAQVGKDGQDRNYSPRELDITQGPGLTSKYNGETVGFDRNEVLNHVAALQTQIQELTKQLKGMNPAEGVGARAVADNPELASQEMRTAQGSYARHAAQNGYKPRPGLQLNANQQKVAMNKAANTEQFAEQFRHAPDARYYNRGTPGVEDEANLQLRLDGGRDVPHEDPLEEERAQREQIVNRGGADAGIAHIYNRARDEEVEQRINELAKGADPREAIRPRPALDYNPSGTSLDDIRSLLRQADPGYSGTLLNELANAPFLRYLQRRRG